MSRTVLTYGTFDLFHVGHVLLLQRAAALGDRLIVGLSTDQFNEEKGKRAVQSYRDRELILRACRYVDDVFPEVTWGQKVDDVQRLGVHTFVMGDDWQGKFDFLKEYCQVTYLERTPEISTTILRTTIRVNAE